jgi:hypothetical protein
MFISEGGALTESVDVDVDVDIDGPTDRDDKDKDKSRSTPLHDDNSESAIDKTLSAMASRLSSSVSEFRLLLLPCREIVSGDSGGLFLLRFKPLIKAPLALALLLSSPSAAVTNGLPFLCRESDKGVCSDPTDLEGSGCLALLALLMAIGLAIEALLKTAEAGAEARTLSYAQASLQPRLAVVAL